MRLLAEFIMHGRAQAICMALLGGLIPYLSQASLGLVSLRRGWQEGVIIALAASAPPILGLILGKAGSTIVMTTIGVFAVTLGTAMILRALSSWPVALVVNMLLCICCGLVLGFDEVQIKADLLAFIADLKDQGSGIQGETFEAAIAKLTKVQITGAIAFMFQMASLPGLILARWMQATLYNPGGFRDEFYALRFNRSFAALCLVAYLLGLSLGPDNTFWAMLFALPMVVVGFGLVHHLMAKAGVGRAGFVAFYIAFVLLRPISIILLVVLCVSDAFFNYRNKFKFKP